MQAQTKNRILNVFLIVIAAGYLLALLRIVLLKSGFGNEFRSLQFIPFRFIQDLLHPETGTDVVLKNVLGNFAIFIPLGILLPAFFKKLSFGKTVLVGFLTSLCFELVQFATGWGMTDIDDLILNTLGCLAGAGLYFGLLARGGKPLRAKLLSVILLAAFGCCGLLALWMYAPGVLPSQIVYENVEALGGIDRMSYEKSDTCIGISADTVTLRDDAADVPLADGALIVVERHACQYSPNGNVQKTFVRYETVDAATAAEMLATRDGGFIDLWFNAAGECRLLVLTVFDD